VNTEPFSSVYNTRTGGMQEEAERATFSTAVVPGARVSFSGTTANVPAACFSAGHHWIDRLMFAGFCHDPAVGGPGLKRRLSMLRAFIFDSSVDEGILSVFAAPSGPDTRPFVCASAVSLASLS